jgi:hypothetical protein
MGLDMYLSASFYCGGWDHIPAEQRKPFDQVTEALGIRHLVDDGSPSLTVDVHVGYWRKANQIHQWFVSNVQGGVDECQRAYVERDRLSELRDACKRVLNLSELAPGTINNGKLYKDGEWHQLTEPGLIVVNPELAQEHLPTQSGFFFGSTDYDQYYIYDLTNTIEIIDRCLASTALDEATFYYQSSW